MTAVTIRGTFPKDSRPSNGLEGIATQLYADKAQHHFVVGVVKWAGGGLDEDGALIPAVKFLAIEPVDGEAADVASKLLDVARKARQLGRFEDEHPVDSALFDFDGDGKPTITEAAETRLGPDGEHAVPTPSAEEVLAERAEAKAAKGKPSADPFTPGDAA